MKIEDIARVCHESIRAYCQTIDDNVHLSWKDSPEWQRASVTKGVEFVRDNPGAGQSAQHEAWLADKTANGWKHGPTKDVANKEHPCFVPYDQLPEEQKLKDVLFQAVARALLNPA